MAKEHIFYRLERTGGKIEWVKELGNKVLIDSYTLYGYKTTHKDEEVYYLVEENSGSSFGSGKNKREATKMLRERLERYTKDEIDKEVKRANELYGKSPAHVVQPS